MGTNRDGDTLEVAAYCNMEVTHSNDFSRISMSPDQDNYEDNPSLSVGLITQDGQLFDRLYVNELYLVEVRITKVVNTD